MSFLVARSNTSIAFQDADAINVVCAWPVSGQYGAGSRLLYYVLIAGCVLARKVEWIKNAALAAALIIPAVAALHGIVLATFHVDGAVDMDIFGVFQVCSIGILVAPITVRLSQTYFNEPGRNAIFLWAGILVAGLMSLAVEFFRATPTQCTVRDNNGTVAGLSDFPYDNLQTPSCDLHCSSSSPNRPHSPIRDGASDGIFLIPAPSKLTFGTATLLTAGCCVYAILWMASILITILRAHWKRNPTSSSVEDQVSNTDQPLTGTNGATEKSMTWMNDRVRLFLSIAVIPVFGGAAIAVLVIGEINLFSAPVIYQTEPMSSVGQWAPIVGTGLTIFGSLYMLLVQDVEAVKKHRPLAPMLVSTNGTKQDCTCSCTHQVQKEIPQSSYSGSQRPSSSRSSSPRPLIRASPLPACDRESRKGHGVRGPQESHSTGGRRLVAETIVDIGEYMDHTARGWADNSNLHQGPARDYPEIPGERQRNRELPKIRAQYNHAGNANAKSTSSPSTARAKTRTESPGGMTTSGSSQSGISSQNCRPTTGDGAPLPLQQRSKRPQPADSSSRRPPPLVDQRRANGSASTGSPAEAYEMAAVPGLSGGEVSRGRPPLRRAHLLEVPLGDSQSHWRSASTGVLNQPVEAHSSTAGGVFTTAGKGQSKLPGASSSL